MTSHTSPVAPTRGRLSPLGIGDAHLTDGVWAAWQRDNAATSLPHAQKWMERDGSLDAFRRLHPGADDLGERRSIWFSDSDIYKVLEGASWELARDSDDRAAVQEQVDALIALVAAAQAEDGYVNTYVQAGLGQRFENLQMSHEMYCMGHLIQAAVAHHRATGGDALLAVAVRAADHLVAEFGEGRRPESDGHQEIEMALVELYRTTGTRAYLDLARQFIDGRGVGIFVEEPGSPVDGVYLQDDVPLRQRERILGHAVRAMYYLAGAIDVAVETDDTELLAAVQRISDSVTSEQLYLTGALGSRQHMEALGEPHELPQDVGYGETCATIGYMGVAWRLLLATGEARYADLFERGLYNLFAASTSLDRTGFFYSNPGQRRRALPAAPVDDRPDRAEAPGTRPAWFWCACCPPNVIRTVASLGAYAMTSDAHGIQVQQFFPGEYTIHTDAGSVRLGVQTRYPDDGVIEITVLESPAAPWKLSVRRPGWVRHAEVTTNGQIAGLQAIVEGDAVSLTAEFAAGDRMVVAFEVEPRWTVGHPAADAVRGTVALERGPVVYALESVDQNPGIDLESIVVDADAPVTEVDIAIGDVGVRALRAQGRRVDGRAWAGFPWADRADAESATGEDPVDLTFIPYALWANRGPSTMRVHVPVLSR
ncbi:glycoside hydrolase family 127 protein [Microbacterium sp. RU33B]|uniref:glycoside hydrolase family 127 protein n=1 Tax=Microbacterium sp. RU33B TaxID=1907390 RepID=UPI0015C3BFD2|nr:beta-L-arabinofuranosidase domain-containing protein [Microbacterium sp. RU33B]